MKMSVSQEVKNTETIEFLSKDELIQRYLKLLSDFVIGRDEKIKSVHVSVSDKSLSIFMYRE